MNNNISCALIFRYLLILQWKRYKTETCKWIENGSQNYSWFFRATISVINSKPWSIINMNLLIWQMCFWCNYCDLYFCDALQQNGTYTREVCLRCSFCCFSITYSIIAYKQHLFLLRNVLKIHRIPTTLQQVWWWISKPD